MLTNPLSDYDHADQEATRLIAQGESPTLARLAARLAWRAHCGRLLAHEAARLWCAA